MGRMAVIAVISLAFTMGIMIVGINKRKTDAVKNYVGYYNSTRARDIAESVVEIYVKKLRQDSTMRGSFALSPIMGGDASISISNLHPLSNDTVLLATTGTYVDQSVSIRNTLVVNLSRSLPFITGAMAFSSEVTKANFKVSNTDSINGRNYNSATGAPTGSCADVHSITMKSTGNVQYPNSISGHLYASGNGGGPTPPDTAAMGIQQPNYDALQSQLISLRDTLITTGASSPIVWGTDSYPRITYVKAPSGTNVTYSALVSGVGILILEGAPGKTISFNNGLGFKGLIFIVGTTTDVTTPLVKINNFSGCYGAVIGTGPYNYIETTGISAFKYSCDAIEKAFSLPKLAGTGRYIIDDWWE